MAGCGKKLTPARLQSGRDFVVGDITDRPEGASSFRHIFDEKSIGAQIFGTCSVGPRALLNINRRKLALEMKFGRISSSANSLVTYEAPLQQFNGPCAP